MISRQSIAISVSSAALAVMIAYSGLTQPLSRSDAAAPPPPAPPSAKPPAAPAPPPPAAPPATPPAPPSTNTTTTTITPPALGTPTLTYGNFTDLNGQVTSLNDGSAATTANPFFHPLGTNGRACASCHKEDQGWSITPPDIQALFNSTQGTDPLFSTVDGSNSPNALVATLAERESAYSELLTKGLIRVGLPIPANAQFTLSAVSDPYKYASAAQLSLFRRPLPATNISFLSTVMFDGRFTVAGQSIESDLAAQAANAVATHEQGTIVPTAAQLSQMVAFEESSFTAQSFDNNAGLLDADNATGGPSALSLTTFTPGVNDPGSVEFNPNVFTLYSAWAPPVSAKTTSTTPTAAQQSIQRGEQIFNTRQFTVSGVPGFNDVIGKPTVQATCSSCHNTPDVGDHSSAIYIDLGLTDPPVATPDLPKYTLKNNATGAVRVTTDPGRALVTGQWSDIGKFKVPTLRGLPARAPYFHNGFAPTIPAVIQFYNHRFNIGFSQQQQTDLANFLSTL